MCCAVLLIFFFFFSSRRRHTRYWRDWSSDVCSSDLGAGPAGVGGAPGRRRVVVLLRGLGEHVRRDGDRLLRAAGLGMFRGLQDLRAVPVQPHRRRPERAADLAHRGGALHAVVAVGVVAGEAAELVPGQLGCPAVVVRGLLPGGGAGERPELQQRAGGPGAGEAAVADDRAVVGALLAAGVGLEVPDERRAAGPQREGTAI